MSGYRGTSHEPSASSSQSATVREYHHLKSQILSCGIPPGSTLFEGALAETLGMSKTPVREALGMLSHEGFVQVRPRQGYRVTEVTLADVQEMFHLRVLLEPAAAELAARNATAEQLATLRELSVHSHDMDYAALVQQASDFHVALAAASGSARLAAMLENLLEEGERLFFLGLDLTADVQVHDSDHADLLEALEKRDAILARETARRQVETSRANILAAVTAALTNPLPGGAASSVSLYRGP